jgi:ABC-type multidrug transport system ATPase subunit
MKAAANNVGLQFTSLFFDEALDGLDTDLKLKAFNLFESLAQTHETIFVIDHSPELQNLFHKKYYVILENDNSKLLED